MVSHWHRGCRSLKAVLSKASSVRKDCKLHPCIFLRCSTSAMWRKRVGKGRAQELYASAVQKLRKSLKESMVVTRHAANTRFRIMPRWSSQDFKPRSKSFDLMTNVAASTSSCCASIAKGCRKLPLMSCNPSMNTMKSILVSRRPISVNECCVCDPDPNVPFPSFLARLGNTPSSSCTLNQ